MRKRLGIARTLLLDYPIEIYDDPTAGLDPVTSDKILNLIESHTKNKLIIIATNEIKSLLSWVDGVILIKDQKIFVCNPNDWKIDEFL